MALRRTIDPYDLSAVAELMRSMSERQRRSMAEAMARESSRQATQIAMRRWLSPYNEASTGGEAEWMASTDDPHAVVPVWPQRKRKKRTPTKPLPEGRSIMVRGKK
jgi:hypothetical protein